MSWLYGQTWLWYLIAFAVGVLLAWLFFVLPATRRLRALRNRAAAPVAATDRRADVENSTETTAVIPAVDEAVTEQFPAVDPALSTLDAQGVAGGVGGDTAGAYNAFEATTEFPVITPETGVEAAGDTADSGTTPDSPADAASGARSGATAAGVAGLASAMASSAATSENAGSTTTVTEPDAATESAPGATSGATALGVAGLAGSGKSTGSATATIAAATPVTHDPATNGRAASNGAAAPAATAEADGPYGPGSAMALADGSAPGPDYTIKGNAGSKLFHTTESPYFVRTKAEAWFRTAADAEAAGFTAWNKRRPATRQSAAQGIAAAPVFTPGPFPLSAKPNADGSAPTPEFTIKGNADSMLYHAPTSPYYRRTKAEAWFRTGGDAEAAGFTAWRRK